MWRRRRPLSPSLPTEQGHDESMGSRPTRQTTSGEFVAQPELHLELRSGGRINAVDIRDRLLLPPGGRPPPPAALEERSGGGKVARRFRLSPPGAATRMVMERITAGRDVVQHVQHIEHATSLVVMDRDQDLYDLRALQPPPVLPPDRVMARPALLLGGRAEVTPFIGRTAEKAALSQWYESPGPVSVMLVHGQGGQGKTRRTTCVTSGGRHSSRRA